MRLGAGAQEGDLNVEGAVDAVVTLVQSGQRDAWVERANWLLEEAPSADKPAERARALLVVTELLAMSGEEARAEELAREALGLCTERSNGCAVSCAASYPPKAREEPKFSAPEC